MFGIFPSTSLDPRLNQKRGLPVAVQVQGAGRSTMRADASEALRAKCMSTTN